MKSFNEIFQPKKDKRMPTVLIVDDNPQVIKVVRSHVKAMRPDALVITAKQGRSALQIVSLLDIDLIITDFEMPIMDGVKLSEEVKKHRPTLTVILTSGRGEPKNHKADAFVKKPILREDLTTTIISVRSAKKPKRA